LLSSFIGIHIHILLDSLICIDIQPFFPLKIKPFYRSIILPGLLELLNRVWCFVGVILI